MFLLLINPALAYLYKQILNLPVFPICTLPVLSDMIKAGIVSYENI